MNEQLIQFLDKYGLEGGYSGGNDSGGLDYFRVLHEPSLVSEKALVNMDDLKRWVYNRSLTDYGSWAGEWDASGDIYYNKKNKTICIEGTETGEDVIAKSCKFKLLPFFGETDLKRVSYVYIGMVDHQEPYEVIIHVENGPWTASLEKAETAIREHLKSLVEKYQGDEYFYGLTGQFKPGEEITLNIQEKTREDRIWEIPLEEEEFIVEEHYK